MEPRSLPFPHLPQSLGVETRRRAALPVSGRMEMLRGWGEKRLGAEDRHGEAGSVTYVGSELVLWAAGTSQMGGGPQKSPLTPVCVRDRLVRTGEERVRESESSPKYMAQWLVV